MRCSQIKSKLSAFHDGELGRSEAEAVREHLLNCQPCRDEVAGLRSISRWLEPPAPAAAVSVDFTDRVFDRIHRNDEGATATRYLISLRTMRIVAVAAGVIACVSALYLAAPRSSDGTLNAASEREVEERIELMRGNDGSVVNAAAPAGMNADRAAKRMNYGGSRINRAPRPKK
ncbi:MAG: zf-HC2 domain-containing protein [Planctomycetes bacterium]|nr:zf-HC2 domain-containing protein [Planctomycetota bacterium]